MGERATIALVHHAAAARMAVGEALTNIAAATIGEIGNIALSANWMAAADHPGEEAGLYDAVKAVGLELCPALGIAIPVGKDSLSMKTVWQEGGKEHAVTAPLSLVVTAFAPVADVRKTLTPQLRTNRGDTDLIFIDLGKGANRLGGSALAQVYKQTGHHAPDVDDAAALTHFFNVIQTLNQDRLLQAYHDRSDGGLFVTLCEMCFAGHVGATITLDALGDDVLAVLFSEELGALLQVKHTDTDTVLTGLRDAGLASCSHVIGTLNEEDQVILRYGQKILMSEQRSSLHRLWSETTWRMQTLRDNPQCAQQEYDTLLDNKNPGLHAHLSFDPEENIAAPYISRGKRPRVAILREQGVNGHIEMAAAFSSAGFDSIDVHMSDIIEGRISLRDMQGIVACGGFSYGDVLGAGEGWAKSILHNARTHDVFAEFFSRKDTFSLGVCNGCQMMSHIKGLIPGTTHWPQFLRNQSEQFEARFVLVEVLESSSLFFQGMAGSRLPITVAHGEGRATFESNAAPRELLNKNIVSLRYVNNYGKPTENYPANPNGSPSGITGLSNEDGRVTIIMPHPERVFRSVQNSWHPNDWGPDAPWLRFFRNARKWLS